jgi:hypothetical protein
MTIVRRGLLNIPLHVVRTYAGVHHDALAKRVICVSYTLVLGPWLRSALYVQAVSGPGSAAASFSHCHDVDLTKMAIETRGHRRSSCNSPASALDITLLARL